jgi:2-keto-3-deoxy-L-rhamnonate aldolase RhmA
MKNQNKWKTIRAIAKENGIDVVFARKGDAGKQGIHKLNPTTQELHDALDTAERDLFTTVYIHNEKTWLVA